jgi:hypothetical protein
MKQNKGSPPVSRRVLRRFDNESDYERAENAASPKFSGGSMPHASEIETYKLTSQNIGR